MEEEKENKSLKRRYSGASFGINTNDSTKVEALKKNIVQISPLNPWFLSSGENEL
jgi:hypothetical protein